MTDRWAEAHKEGNIKGPDDGRPSALQIVEDDHLVGKLSDKVMLVTGCTPGGIGPETVRALAATGAKVYATARDVARGKQALEGILEPGRVELLQLDQSSLENVRTFAKDFLSKNDKLNVLVCNAAIMALQDNEKTVDGHEAQFATNHLSHFLLFQLLKPLLLKSSTPEFNSRVVAVASSGHRHSGVHFEDLGLDSCYTPFIAYGQSKTANIYMAHEIDRRYGSKGLHGYSLHPGGIWTGLQKHQDFSAHKGKPEVERNMKSPAQGAATQVWAAVGKVWEGNGGKYLDDCQICPPAPEKHEITTKGHSKHVYDVDAQKKLWDVSCQMVDVKDD